MSLSTTSAEMDVRRAKRTKTESDEYKYSRVRKRNGENNQSKSRNRHPIALQHQTKSTVKLEKTTLRSLISRKLRLIAAFLKQKMF